MKTLLALIIAITACAASAQTNWTYSTNLFYALTYPTNIYIGTNGTDAGGDNFHVWANKINASMNLFWPLIQTNEANIATNTGQLANLASLQTNTFTAQVFMQKNLVFQNSAATNTWNLYIITNSLGTNGAFWLGNSNGAALVSVWMSNGVPIIKQLAP